MPVASFLNQTVQRKAKSGHDAYGKVQIGSAANIEARFQESHERAFDDNGKEYEVDAELWVKPTQTINLEDIIIVSSANYRVVKTSIHRDVTGRVHHKKALLVKTESA